MATKAQSQILAEYWAARLIIAALGALPIRSAIRMGERLGDMAYHLTGNLRRTAERNLAAAFPEKTEAERFQLLRGSFRNLGRGLGIFSKFSTASREDLLSMIDLHGIEHLDEATAQNVGVILFTGHLGSWELTSFSLSLIARPFTFLVRRLDNPKIEQLIDQSRGRFGNKTLDKRSAARSMVKTLRSKEYLGLLFDLNTLDDEGIFVDFFGIPASTNFMVAKLALRTGSPIVPMFAPWDEALKKFAVQIEPIVPIPSSGNEEENIQKLTQDLSQITENCIRRYPEQWLWVHKRWKTRPPGEPDFYR